MTVDPRIAPPSPETLRRRLTLLVHLASAAGQFSGKLSDAVGRATDAEVRIMSDLVDRGLTIPALVHLLQGAHVLVGDDSRYQAWIFPTSRRRLSSHHRNVDKRTNPDYGLDGPLVRESLHGKATIGTWVQFERTSAHFRWGELPTWDDVLHLRDYVIYRLTGKNVGPWGLSANVDTRPILLRAPHRTPGRGALRGLAILTARPGADRTDGRRVGATTAASEEPGWVRLLSPGVPMVGPFGDLYTAANTADSPQDLLPDKPWDEDLREGLFGSLAVLRWSNTLAPGVAALLDATTTPSLVELDEGLPTGSVELRVREARIVTRTVREDSKLPLPLASPDQEPDMSAEPDPAPRDVADVGLVARDDDPGQDLHAQLEEFAELVRTGPVRLGAYTQAELGVVLGDAPALRGSSDEVLAEAARSLAARGVLFRDPASDQVTVVGDLGLVLALATARIGTLEIRRGHTHTSPTDPWRWLITVLPLRVVALDRVDTLGLHRLSVHSVQGVADAVTDQLLDGSARVPRDEGPIAIDADEARTLLERGLTRWQLLLRLPQPDGAITTVEAHVVRTSDHRVDLITRDPEGTGHTRTAVDARSLRHFLVQLFMTR